MDNSQVAKVYAKALLEAGQDARLSGEFETELKDVLTILKQNQDIWNFFLTPRVSREYKLDSLDKAFKGKVSDSILSFLSILIRNNRLDAIAQIYSEYIILNDKLNGVIRAKVQTATSLANDEISEIKKWFLDTYKAKAEIETSVRPELIGGVVIFFDDKVIDGSILSKLNTMKKSLSLHADEKLISNKNTGAYYEN
ncbi:MAG: ATP synthase F1 subunit delta [Spirochaetia bacterium]|nr:ATP synthase F1 subunit delta [Spirochaetia bacterium]